ncbi:phage tail protein [Pseudomonas sp. zfem001]|uniref:phage tail protein n=1 Tax=Pseudomonas sp. zfem001 TaxID=3078196 RepID=UPI00292A3227|nr:phage tail protein [Pseudomonas sp. zfem001]MDU9408231.1 phage tail protein [Pseudomonas sp. zfem001]
MPYIQRNPAGQIVGRFANLQPGTAEEWLDEGSPDLIPSSSAKTAELCARIDTAADAARRAVAGDPLRAVEYDRARLAAEQFAAAGYEGEVPAMVAAWAINGRTPQQAADSILAEAAAYTHALELLRTTRLAAKEQIRALMAANQVEQAQQLADQTIAAIEAAVAGIGNNA